MSDTTANGNYIELTAEIVSAYVSNNTVPAGEIPALISQVHAALSRVSGKSGDIAAEPLRPAVSVKKSITPEYIVCLEDGKKFKSLKRHLRTQYNMTPEQYREKWASAPTIRWWRRITPPPARNWPSRWVSASSAAAAPSSRFRKRSGWPPRLAAAVLSLRLRAAIVADKNPIYVDSYQRSFSPKSTIHTQ